MSAPPSAFARTLDEGLRERGLSLDRVSDHLARRHLSCSRSTLSLWRRGRTRPLLSRSGEVLAGLEEVLRLRPGALREAMSEPDPSAPEWWDRRVPIHEFDDVQKAYREFRLDTGIRDEDGLDRLFIHTRLVMGRHRGVDTMTHTVLLRANADGADRLGSYFTSDSVTEDGQPVTYELTSVLGGRATKEVSFERLAATAALIELDQPLRAGEHASVRIEWTRVTDVAVESGDNSHDLRAPWPTGYLGLELFCPHEIPSRIQGWSEPRLEADEHVRALSGHEIEPAETVQVAANDVLGGAVRLEWEWGEP